MLQNSQVQLIDFTPVNKDALLHGEISRTKIDESLDILKTSLVSLKVHTKYVVRTLYIGKQAGNGISRRPSEGSKVAQALQSVEYFLPQYPKNPQRTELAVFITSIVLQNIKKLMWGTIGDIRSFEKEVLVPNKIEMNGFKQVLIKFKAPENIRRGAL